MYIAVYVYHYYGQLDRYLSEITVITTIICTDNTITVYHYGEWVRIR